MIKNLRDWMIDCANIMFDDSKSDIRSLPKAVRLQILIVLKNLSCPRLKIHHMTSY